MQSAAKHLTRIVAHAVVTAPREMLRCALHDDRFANSETGFLNPKHRQPPEIPRRLPGVALEKGAEVGHIGKAQAIGNF
jgi:hypothetical protein